jgi:hypothetical protein
MHQHPIPNIVGMEVLNLEVVDFDGCFEQLMLYLLDYDIFAIDSKKYISGFEMDSVSPALLRHIEWMRRRCDYLFAVNRDVNELVRFINYCVGYVESLFASPDAVFNILIIHLK